ncbi:NAD-binding protein [Mycobacteroides abscessus]|uniref:NAD-binding protein n=1 Tax=Mycobacteroides abscessus TaxID=36809 RepID=UPI0010421C7E|nr:NAD-binding protein [Mycobacteroides abscessus]MBN7379710.1 NAD-binding protein [Mycobacteroides abscessus subsp. massiliense]MDM2096382.1 NAD-binding protein [Mycobacteroides abscessus]MDM2121113.1 NAD-binding protein [Mycobacteroides abscessus]MDM2124392.1 NAD-binding protein [Mycobacteroides abscessus]MDM2130577.1 NAD-binding protein [Mycobacteroides abscessus]
MPTNPDHSKARVYFRRILSFNAGGDEAAVVAIVHLVDSAIPFVPVLDETYEVLAFLGKPSSIQLQAQAHLSAALPGKQFILDKSEFRSDPGKIFGEMLPPLSAGQPPKRLVLLDIGGYFAPSTDGLLAVKSAIEARGYRLAGIVEDTQNGHERYKTALNGMAETPDFHVYSVAESPLKKPENHLVGVAVTFSIEALLRQSNLVLQSRRAGVIGFGPIGRSVAHSLRNRGIAVSVCEIDPIRLAQAAAQGFRVFHFDHFEEFVKDLNLVVSATGAGARGLVLPINTDTIRHVRRGTFIASVTSQDDEIDLKEIKELYKSTPLSFNTDVAKWVLNEEQQQSESGSMRFADSSNSPSFYLMLDGNAVNFRHEGVIGPAIQLLQGEILACIGEILRLTTPPTKEVEELNKDIRNTVAGAWLDQYLVDSAVSELD